VCLCPSTQPTWPPLYACLVFSLLSFLHLPLPSVRFIGQAHSGCKRWCLNRDHLFSGVPESEVTPGWETNYGGNLKPKMRRHFPRSVHVRDNKKQVKCGGRVN
jgi:hypothetical protein